jgi:hypothetical protein
MIAANVYIDWDADGAFTETDDDISAYVKGVSWKAGIWDRTSNVARAGRASITLTNLDRRFSPDNTDSPYYGRFKPNLPIRIDATDGLTAWPVFRGVITDFNADSGDLGRREARISAEDLVGVLSRTRISLPMRYLLKGDAALKLVTSAVFRSARATGTVTITANPGDGKTLTIGDTVYTFETGALDAAYKVKVGATPSATALNLAAAINAAQTATEFGYGADTVYGADTIKHPDVSAVSEGLGGAAGGSTNIEPSADSYGYIGKISDGNMVKWGQQFRVNAGTLVELQFYIEGKTGSPGTITWEVCDEIGSVPGNVLQSGTFAPAENQWNVIAVASGVTLYADTNYWVVLRLTNTPSASNNNWHWRLGTSAYAIGISADHYLGAWTARPLYDCATRITTGEVTEAHVYLTAVARGAWGNSIGLATDAGDIALSAATLEGGADGPAGLFDYEASTVTLDEIGATWGQDRTSGLRAIQDVVDSEGTALFWAAGDGTLTFKNRDWLFTRQAEAANLTLDGEMQQANVSVSLADITNRVTVRYRPRNTRATGIIAQSTGTISVPGTGLSGSSLVKNERHNQSDNLPNPDNTAFTRLSYVDTETGQVIGAEDLQLPLVAGTDFTVNDSEDGSGFDYTNSKRVLFSVAATGSGVDVTMQNSAMGTLYVKDLQVRGTAIIQYDSLDVTVEDTTSITNYGLQETTFGLPFTATNAHMFAPILARYLLRRNANPTSYQEPLSFRNVTEVGGTNLYSLDIGDILDVTETQTAISGRRLLITGVGGSIGQGNVATLQWHTWRLDDATYGIWDDDTFGTWDNCVWSI